MWRCQVGGRDNPGERILKAFMLIYIVDDRKLNRALPEATLQGLVFTKGNYSAEAPWAFHIPEGKPDLGSCLLVESPSKLCADVILRRDAARN